MKDKEPSIEFIKDGPIKVNSLEQFENSRGEQIETRPVMMLCRCGHSKKKPYCDGSHSRVGFTDEPVEGRVPDKRETYEGAAITINDNRGICSHAGFCTAGLPQVFKMGVEPWIEPDAASPEEIGRTIRKCPSGALSYSLQGEEKNQYYGDKKIIVSKNGPYHVQGGVGIDPKVLGQGGSPDHYTLCRCGKSGNKPRCDGSHWYAAFKDDEATTIVAAARAAQSTEAKWLKVAERDELKDNQSKKLYLESQQILLSRVSGKYGAVQGLCTHQGGPIIDAKLEEGIIRCPWHGHPFDPISGKSLARDSDLPTFPVEVRDDGVYLKIASPKKSPWTISHVIVETLYNWGIRHIFGMVGHSNLGMAEAFQRMESQGKMTYIGIRHEGAAAFACSGYAKVSGKPAVCFTIAGPGATNLLTGLWDAHLDRVPVLAVTGQVNTQFFGPGSFQELDLKDAFAAVAPFSKLVLPDSRHAELASLAMKHAMVNRCVAHLIVPNDVQTMDVGLEGPGSPDGRMGEVEISPPSNALDLAMYRIWRSERPAVIVGYGARTHMEDIIAFAEALKAPILTTFKAKGQIPDEHPWAAGVLGKSGTPVSAYFMNSADLLIVFGASFSQHTGIDQTKPLIQVDSDRAALARFHAVDNPLWGDAGVTARLFKEKLGTWGQSTITTEEIAQRKVAWKQEKEERAAVDNGKGLASAFIFQELSQLLPEDAIISVDVGNNTYSFGRYFECRGQRVILSGYLGSIGFSFPAAMGAWCAAPGHPIVSISGDGGFGQYMGEFNTAVKYKMNILHILLNNHELGKISKEQRDSQMDVWQTGLSNPNFAEFAKGCGGFGVRVGKREELAAAVKEALAYSDGPAIVEIMSDPLLT